MKNKKFVALWSVVHGLVFFALLIMFLCGVKFKINTNLFDILPKTNASREVSHADAVMNSTASRTFVILVKGKNFDEAKNSAVKFYNELLEKNSVKKLKSKNAQLEAQCKKNSATLNSAAATSNSLNSDAPIFFESLNLFVSDNLIEEVSDYFYQNRFKILSEENIETINSKEKISDFIAESLLNIYSGNVSTKSIDDDPFLFTEVGLSNTLSKIMSTGTSMSAHDGVLCTYVGDDCYVMIRGLLTPQAASITNKKSGVKLIYDVAKKLDSEKVRAVDSSGKRDFGSAEPGKNENFSVDESLKIDAENSSVKFIFSGVPFHSYESSSSAQFEITIISVVSMILIIALCFFVFRSGLPVLFSVGAITLSAIFALASCFVVFRQIHILTFVFGTTLIGTCLDYSVHFFVRWKGDKSLNSGKEIRTHLFKGITFSFFSTAICYAVLFFAPFSLLKQVAIFSLAGICSSYLTVLCLYPMLKMPAKKGLVKFQFKKIEEKKFINSNSALKKVQPKFKINRYGIFAILIFLMAIIFVISYKNVKIENNLRSFYSMKGELLQNEIESNKVLDTGSSGWYFIIRGDSEENVLENEYNFCKRLDSYISSTQKADKSTEKKSSKMTYNAITKFIPPQSLQKKSYDAIKNLFEYLPEQFEFLGYDLAEQKKLTDEFIQTYELNRDTKISISNNDENALPEFMKDAISNLWIDEVDGEYFSVVMPMHFSDSAFCKSLTLEDDNVFFMNKMSDVESELNHLTKLIFIFLVIAFFVIAIVLKFFFSFREIFKILVIPVVTVFGTISILAFCKVPLGFFSVTGIVLVFGLGIDYILYSVQNSEKLNTVAVVLSFLSSALSFGALALSSFAPVFMFGLAVFVGLTIAVLCTVLLK